MTIPDEDKYTGDFLSNEEIFDLMMFGLILADSPESTYG